MVKSLRMIATCTVMMVSVAILSSLFAGCATVSPNTPSGISQGLRSTLETLRDPWGLYVDPTIFDSPVSIYSTALIDEALGRPESHPSDTGVAVKQLCASDERKQVEEPWFTWALTTTLGKAAGACANATIPQPTGTVENDIPQYFAWVKAQLVLGVSKGILIDEAQKRLAAITTATNSPYVMWRADQIEDLLGISSSSEQRAASAPTQLLGPDDLTELWGYTMRCAARSVLCSARSAIDDQQVAVAAVSYPDDLSFAAGIAILRARNSNGYLSELTKSVDARRNTSLDFLRSSRFTGSIDASYAVLELAPDLFPGDSPEITSAELLRRYTAIPNTEKVTRLRILALLKAVDFRVWSEHKNDLKNIFDSYQTTRINEIAMKDFLDAAGAFGVMNEDPPAAELQLFDANSPESIYHARLALGNSWAFNNDDELLSHFSGIGKDSLAAADNPSEPIVSYIAGLSAINGLGQDISQERRTAISATLNNALKGCVLNGKRTDTLYRFSLDPVSSCSLKVTVDAIHSSFGE